MRAARSSCRPLSISPDPDPVRAPEKGALPTVNQNSRTRSQDHRASSLHTVARAVLIGGGALAVFGLTRRSRAGMALAAAGGLMAAGSRKIEAESQEYSAKAR